MIKIEERIVSAIKAANGAGEVDNIALGIWRKSWDLGIGVPLTYFQNVVDYVRKGENEHISEDGSIVVFNEVGYGK